MPAPNFWLNSRFKLKILLQSDSPCQVPFNLTRHLYFWPAPDAELGAGATTPGTGVVTLAAQYLEKSGEVGAGGGQVPDAAQVSSLHCMMSSSQSKSYPKLFNVVDNTAENVWTVVVIVQLQQQQPVVSPAMHVANMFLKYGQGPPAIST